MVNVRPLRWLSLTWFACVANKYDIATAKTKTTTTTPTTTTYNMRCRMLASRIRAAERARKFNLGAAGRAPARLRRFREAAEGDACPCARLKTKAVDGIRGSIARAKFFKRTTLQSVVPVWC